jgi:hypothetical protein
VHEIYGACEAIMPKKIHPPRGLPRYAQGELNQRFKQARSEMLPVSKVDFVRCTKYTKYVRM